MLLKSSDQIANDLEQVLETNRDASDDAPRIEPELVLRKWYALHPAMEFRCFVVGGRLKGTTMAVALSIQPAAIHASLFAATCQMDMQYYEFLHDASDRLQQLISALILHEIQPKLGCSNCKSMAPCLADIAM